MKKDDRVRKNCLKYLINQTKDHFTIIITIIMLNKFKKINDIDNQIKIFHSDDILMITLITSFLNCSFVLFFTGTFLSFFVSSILIRYFGSPPQSGHCDRFFNQSRIHLKQNLCLQLSGLPSGYFNCSKHMAQFDSIFFFSFFKKVLLE